MLRVSRTDISSTEITEFPIEERFMKLPVEKFLEVEGLTPLSPQIALINAVNNPKYRFVTACLSRRVGKTTIANIIGNIVVLVPGSNVLIMSPNYSLSQISWDLQRRFLGKFEIELERSNAKDKIIELKNGSTIRMGSISQADSVVGRSYDLIIFDEAALNDDGESVFNIQLRPTLDKANSKAIFISTPRGKNWFYDFFNRGFDPEYDAWASIHCDYRENPRVSTKDIEEARRTMSKAHFKQEYEADFVALEGRIYDLNPEQVREYVHENYNTLDVIAGIDVGFRDSTAMVVVLTDGETFYVVDEYVSSEKTTEKHAEKVSQLMKKWDIDFIYIDAAAQQTRHDFAELYDIATVNAKKSVLDGIGFVATLVDNNKIFIDPKCKNTLSMLENYRWDNREGLTKERPYHDANSHIADALRYALYSHSYILIQG